MTTREYITFGMRLVTFALTLALMGAFFLPWVRLDGESEARSGVETIALIMSPTFDYLVLVSQERTLALVSIPVLMLVATLVIMCKYVNRRPALVATFLVLVGACSLPYAAQDLMYNGNPQLGIGLQAIAALSVLLLVQQILIRVATILGSKQKLPGLHRTLRTATGSGTYQIPEN